MTGLANKSLAANQSASSDLPIQFQGDLPDRLFTVLMEYTGYAMICIGIFGMAGNILILMTYVKIGLSVSINISYFALGISDILCIIFITWNAICYIPAFANSDIPFNSRKFVIPTGGHPSIAFLKTTGWITAYISIERCLCVVFPMKIKTIVKPRRTVVIIVLIFILIVLPLLSIAFYTFEFNLRFDSAKNRTLMAVKFKESSLSASLTNFNRTYKAVFLSAIPFVIILVCAVILAISLNRNASWRLRHSSGATTRTAVNLHNDDKAERKYAKDIRVAKSVLAIAVTFLCLGTYSTLRYIVALCWPNFHPAKGYTNLYDAVARLEILLSLANSSINFIIYYKMGKKFRETVKHLILPNYSG